MTQRLGQVLVELLLAMAVSSVALVGMAEVATKSLSNASFAANNSDANKYVVQAIEWLRLQKNSGGWQNFTAHADGAYCLNSDLTTNPPMSGAGAAGVVVWTNGGTSCASHTINGDPNIIFEREIDFSGGVGMATRTVSVIVHWTEKGVPSTSTQTIVFKQY